MDLHFTPGPREFLIFAVVLAVFFIAGFAKKPPAGEDGAWLWWVAMLVFGGCIVYFVLRAVGVL